MVVDGRVDEAVADLGAVMLSAGHSRPWTRQPPPGGTLPSFFTSTWTRSPGCLCS